MGSDWWRCTGAARYLPIAVKLANPKSTLALHVIDFVIKLERCFDIVFPQTTEERAGVIFVALVRPQPGRIDYAKGVPGVLADFPSLSLSTLADGGPVAPR